MKISLFREKSAGRLVPVTGIPEITHAFVPAPLPPQWEWPEKLWPLLLKAHQSLSNLNGTGKYLPNPELLLRPLQNREAQKSSSLEGTYTDPQQQLLFGLNPRQPASADDPLNALTEVFNYAYALRARRETELRQLPLSLRLIRELHGILMKGVRGANRDPGRFRRTQNQIGRPPRYVPPPTTSMRNRLDNFEKYLYQPRRLDPLVEAFLVHYQFEAIHPFMDGNGRVGRLLLAIIIEEWCGLNQQWLYMSDYFDRNKDLYIERLFRVSTEGAWADWIEFCLEGVVRQAADTTTRCEGLITLNRDLHERVSTLGGSVRLTRIVDDLFIHPIAVVSRVAQSFGVSYPTARSDLRKLAKAGVLTRLTKADQITYYCRPIIDLTFAD